MKERRILRRGGAAFRSGRDGSQGEERRERRGVKREKNGRLEGRRGGGRGGGEVRERGGCVSYLLRGCLDLNLKGSKSVVGYNI